MTVGEWVDIQWYRDFHDVPRLFCVVAPSGVLVFDCPFENERDDYAMTYAVHRVSGVDVADVDSVIQVASTTKPIAVVPVDKTAFDVTRRQKFRLPSGL